ncbi:MAG: hypothetical protein AAFP90_23940, partial [Planctomycetota bacterium]
MTSPTTDYPALFVFGSGDDLRCLQHQSGLPGHWFFSHPGFYSQGVEQTAGGIETANSPRISLCDLNAWGLGTASTEAGIGETQALAKLTSRTVAHLLVISDNSESDTVDQALNGISALIDRCQTLLPARHGTIQHTVILVDQSDAVSGAVPENLCQHLVELQRTGKIQSVHAMTQLLEPKGRQFFAARAVWPVAVGRLLFHWMHDETREQSAAEFAYAWRLIPFPPHGADEENQTVSRIAASSLKAMFDRVFRSEVDTVHEIRLNAPIESLGSRSISIPQA